MPERVLNATVRTLRTNRRLHQWDLGQLCDPPRTQDADLLLHGSRSVWSVMRASVRPLRR